MGNELRMRFIKPDWLIVVTFVILISSFGTGLTNPILSLYGSSYTNSGFLVGLFIMIFAFGRVVATIPASYLFTRWGHIRVMSLGLLLKAVGVAGIAFAQSFLTLLIPRFIDGIGDALFMSSSLLAVTNGSMSSTRGKNISMYQFGAFLGLAISPALGGWLADQYGIRVPIIVQSILSLTIIPILLYLSTHTKKWVNLKYLAATENENNNPSPLREHSLGSDYALVAIAAFLIFILRAGARDTLLPIYARDQINVQPTEIGVLFNIFAVMNLVSVPISGYFSDKIGPKFLVTAGLLMLGCGSLLTGYSSSYSFLIVCVILMACGKGFSEPATIVYLSNITTGKAASFSFGLFLTIRDFGLLLGPILLGGLADLAGINYAYILTGVVCLCCSLLFLWLAKEHFSKPD